MATPKTSGTITITHPDIRNQTPSGGPNYAYYSTGVIYYDWDDGDLPTGDYTANGAVTPATGTKRILYLGYRNRVRPLISGNTNWHSDYKVTQLAIWRKLGLRSTNSGYGAGVWDAASTLVNSTVSETTYPVNSIATYKFTRSGALMLYGTSYAVKLTIAPNGGTATTYAGLSYVYMLDSASMALPPAITRGNSSNSTSYTISYNANGGNSTPSSHSNTKYTSYAFSKWTIGSTDYNASASVTLTADSTATAKWSTTVHQNATTLAGAIAHSNTTSTRTVTFNANGGSVSPSSRNSTATVTWSFAGWKANNSGTAYSGGASYTPSANVTMYAAWNTSTGSFSSVSLPTPTKTGYTCSGWYTSASGGTKRGAAGGSYTPSASETIYAQWTGIGYSVAFNKNGGSGSMSTQTGFVYGTAKALKANAFTAPSGGYSFGGWATSVANATAGTVAYANQANMTTGTTTNGGTVTLYAIWKRTITFYSGSSKATTNTVTQYYNGSSSAGAAITSPAGAAITNWTKLGFRDDTSAGAKEISYSASFTPSATTYYAVYSRSVTFYHGYNKAASTSATQYYNTNGAYAVTTPTAATCTDITYWTEIGWRDDTTASSQEVGFNASSSSSSATFYAVYKQTASLTYNGNGNTGGSTSATTSSTRYLNSGNTTLSSTSLSWTLASNGFTKTGHTFSAWDRGAVGATYTRTLAYNANPASTATAQWTPNTYTVTLNQNGGAGGTTSVTATYNSAMPSATMPTRIGYTFAGYYDATSGGTQYYTSAGASARNWDKTSATTLYARWTVKTTTFKLDPNKGTLAAQAGGSENATTKDYTYNYGTTQTLPSPVRTGYTFRCWARNMSGSEVINYGRAFMWTDYFQAAFFVYQADWSAITTYAPGIASAACSIASCTESGGWSMGIATSSYKPFVQFYDPGASAYKTAYATDAITTWSAGWHLINVLYKDKIMYLYKDGTIIATTATGTNAISYHSVNSLFQAGEPNGTQNGIGNSNAYYKGKISPIYINHQNTAHTGLIAGASAYNGSYTWTAQYYATANQLIKLNPNGGTVVPQAGGAASSSTENYYYTYGTNQTLPTPTRTGYTFITWGRQMNGTSEAINYGRAHMHTTALRMRIRAYLDNWSTLGTKTIVSCTESGGWSLGNSDGKICFWCYSQEDAAYKNALSTTTWASLAAGWHCFELTFDGTNAKGYVDGTLIATSAAFTTVSGKTTGAIGYNAQNDIFVADEATGTRAGHSGSNYFNGMVGPLYMSESATPVGTGSINAISMFASTSGWTFAAQWQPHTYTVTFKTGNTIMGTQSFTYDTAQNLTAVANLSNAPVSGNGWSFYGWATDVNTNTRTYTDGQSVNNLTATDEGNVTLYAIYSRSISGKYYDSATATTTTNISGVTQYYKNTSTTAAAASSVTFPTLYTYTGQSNSWAPKAWSNGTGTTQTIAAATSGTAASGTPSATSSATYNALYNRTCIITYNGNGNTGGSTINNSGIQWYNAGNNAAIALSMTLADNGFTKTGYKFSKWALNSASGAQYSAGASYTVTNTGWDSSRTAATMYAIWEPFGIIRVPPSLTPSGITLNSNNSITVNLITYLLTIPYVYQNGSWVQHQPFGHDGSSWKVGE